MDELLLIKLEILEKQKKKLTEDNEEFFLNKYSIKAFCQYPEGGYFGDTDIFSFIAGISKNRKRDSIAVSEIESTLFVMNKSEIKLIK